MPRPRYEREEEEIAGPKTRRAVLVLFGFGLLLGLIFGIIWVIAGLLRFHVFR